MDVGSLYALRSGSATAALNCRCRCISQSPGRTLYQSNGGLVDVVGDEGLLQEPYCLLRTGLIGGGGMTWYRLSGGVGGWRASSGGQLQVPSVRCNGRELHVERLVPHRPQWVATTSITSCPSGLVTLEVHVLMFKAMRLVNIVPAHLPE